MRLFTPLAILLLLLTSDLRAQTGTVREGSAEAVPIAGRVIVRLQSPDGDPAATALRLLRPLAERLGSTTARNWLLPELTRAASGMRKGTSRPFAPLAAIVAVTYSAPEDPRIVARLIAALPGVAYAEPEYRRTLQFTPNDPLLPTQWYLERVRALTGWDLQKADSGLIIAILDTGIDPAHPDLGSALWMNPGETGTDAGGRPRSENGRDDDGNGFVDDWIGYDFAGSDARSRDNDPAPGHWHGTHVAGIAAATGNNATGIAGVAHGARLMALKIADDRGEEPTLAGGYDAMLYAVRMGARIINCSWGGGGRSQAEQDVIDAVAEQGALIVAAAGNDGRQIASFPGSYRNVLSVAALRSTDRRASFTNFNPRIGISAPGDEIVSTVPQARDPSGYASASGTSMAAPIVSGAAALVASRWPSLAPEQIAAILQATSDNLDSLNPDVPYMLGTGRINVLRALQEGPGSRFVATEFIEIVDGNGDGSLDPGEAFELRVGVRNHLRPVDGLRLRLVNDGAIPAEITVAESVLGSLATGERRTSSTGTLNGRTPANAPVDYQLALRLELRSGDTLLRAERVELTINPNFATTRTPKLAATFTGNGRIGYSDFPANEQGVGFRLGTSESLLAEGGLLIGTSASRLADVVRGADIGLQSQGLQTREAYRVRFSDTAQAEIGTARFDDAHLHPLQRVGLDVSLTTIAPASSDRDRVIVLLYRVVNTSNETLDSLFAALYMDWDVGIGGLGNQAALDPALRLGAVSNVSTPGLPFVGTMLVSAEPLNFDAMDNGSWPLSGGFYQIEKWDAISSGVRRDRSGVGDCSFVIGAGPLRLGAGADTTIAFALLAGETPLQIQSGAEEARAIVARYGLTPGGPLELPRALSLDAGSPNPFSDRTRITIRTPAEGAVSLEVFDATGRSVAKLADRVLPRGIHSFDFHPANASAGVFFVRLIADGQTVLRKIVRLAEP